MSDFSPADFTRASYADEVPPRYAGFWIRVGATLIDMAIVLGFQYGVLMPLLGLKFGDIYQMPTAADLKAAQAGHSLPHPPASLAKTVFSIVGLIIPYIYYVVLISSNWQATLGKRAVGIYIETDKRKRLSWPNALGRELAKIISAIILMIGYIMVAFTNQKTGLHDMIAGTRVVYGRKR